MLPFMVSSCLSGWAPPTLAKIFTGWPCKEHNWAESAVLHKLGSLGKDGIAQSNDSGPRIWSKKNKK